MLQIVHGMTEYMGRYGINMVLELDIAGEFIYHGVHTLNQMKLGQ